MKSPKKLYILVSRSRPGLWVATLPAFTSMANAKAHVRERNRMAEKDGLVADFRVETYVKGD
jgi:hypothetical protein